MSKEQKNRKRNKGISFRVTPEEQIALNARIAICGIPRGTYFIQSLLHQKINIVAGTYGSDRLSLELKRLRESLEKIKTNEKETQEVLIQCKTLMKQFIEIVEQSNVQDIKTLENEKQVKSSSHLSLAQ